MILQPPRETVQPYFDRLLEPCKEYTGTVSRRAMALSIETCAYLWWVCDNVQAARVADLGSGFSSYVLRRYAADAGYPVTVASVDDSPFWLKETANFLSAHGLLTDGMYRGDTWNQWGYDVIVHDYSSGDTRNEWMHLAAHRLTSDGVLIFDDAQNRGHHMEMGRVARKFGLRLFDVYEQTVDEAGRYAAMAHR